jgi:hypothetical protein
MSSVLLALANLISLGYLLQGYIKASSRTFLFQKIVYRFPCMFTHVDPYKYLIFLDYTSWQKEVEEIIGIVP